jgi:hypothetical protein
MSLGHSDRCVPIILLTHHHPRRYGSSLCNAVLFPDNFSYDFLYPFISLCSLLFMSRDAVGILLFYIFTTCQFTAGYR